MRLVTYLTDEGARPGAVVGDEIADLAPRFATIATAPRVPLEGAMRRDEQLPEHPAFFSKSRTSVIGPAGRDLDHSNALEDVFVHGRIDDGIEKQRSTTAAMIFPLADLVHGEKDPIVRPAISDWLADRFGARR